jgi:D-alanyl-D-alanine carboxypeptidase (penicillin-binding protein 4)
MGLRQKVLPAVLAGVMLAAAHAAAQAPASAQDAPPIARDDPQRPPITRDNIRAFRARVEAILADAKAVRGHWGVLVVDASTGQAVYALNEGRYFTPASNTKLYTTALALATLGPEHRFRTTIETRGRIDAHGRLIGNLISRGPRRSQFVQPRPAL